MPAITIRYAFRPRRRSLVTGQVADLFGLADAEPAHVVADNVHLDIRPGDLVLFTGPSGSGKSSLLRAAGEQLAALEARLLLRMPDELSDGQRYRFRLAFALHELFTNRDSQSPDRQGGMLYQPLP